MYLDAIWNSRWIILILADNVFNAAAGEVAVAPALTESIGNLRVGIALLLRTDDEADLEIRVPACAHHFGEQERALRGGIEIKKETRAKEVD